MLGRCVATFITQNFSIMPSSSLKLEIVLRKIENGLFLFSLKQTPTDSQIDSDPFVKFKNIEKIKTLNLARKDGLDYILCGKGFIILSTLSYIS